MLSYPQIDCSSHSTPVGKLSPIRGANEIFFLNEQEIDSLAVPKVGVKVRRVDGN